MQWEAFKQLVDVRKYANSKNILLKGDLPILVSRDSADVWTHPEFFKLEFAAGAPPDMYCARASAGACRHITGIRLRKTVINI